MRSVHVFPRLAAGLIAAAALLAGGCDAHDHGGRTGRAPPRPTNVAGIVLPEVRPGEPDRPFAFRARPNGVLYVFFGFASCPDICPATLSDLRQALRMLGDDARRIEVALITVDPARDSAAVLAPYLASFVAGGRAIRPGSQADLGRAQAAFGATSRAARGADGRVEVVHTSLGYVVDERGEVLLQWDFGTRPDVMARDFSRLLARVARAGIAIRDPWSRATPAGVTVGAVYLWLESAGGDSLLGAAVAESVAAAVELHETVRDAGGAMAMRAVPALALPAGRAVAFAPGGRHFMLTGLRRRFAAGDTIALSLRFARAGERTVRVPVRD
jgi:protein SCO1/2